MGWIIGTAISFIVVSFLMEKYIQKRIEKTHQITVSSGIAGEIIAMILLLLWAGFIVGGIVVRHFG